MAFIASVFENKRLIIRAVLSLVIVGLVGGIAFAIMRYREGMDKDVLMTLSVILGALITSLHKVTEFWFKRDTDDSEHRTTPGA